MCVCVCLCVCLCACIFSACLLDRPSFHPYTSLISNPFPSPRRTSVPASQGKRKHRHLASLLLPHPTIRLCLSVSTLPTCKPLWVSLSLSLLVCVCVMRRPSPPARPRADSHSRPKFSCDHGLFPKPRSCQAGPACQQLRVSAALNLSVCVYPPRT